MGDKEKKKASEDQDEEQAIPEEEKAQFDDDEDEEPGEEPEEKPDDEPNGEPDNSPVENRPRKKHLEMGKTKFSLSIVIIAAAFFAAGFLVNAPTMASCNAGTDGQMTSDQAADFAVGFINDYLLQPGVTAELINVTEANGVYEFEMGFTSDQGSMVYTSYVTKDGKLLFTSAVDMSETPDIPEDVPQETQDTGVPKSDRPQVDIFVMSYCPYGLQMQKAAIPAMDLLKDVADINVRFVYYIMHGQSEIDENTRQYCIQKEQSDKFLDYLDCFTLTDDTEACRASAGVDEAMMEACIAAADTEFSITANYEDTASWLSGSFPLYDVDADLNTQYGVGGSPTVVINGQQASVSRSPEGFKQAVCAAFNTPPEECSTALSSEAASPGIGGGTGTTADAGCGA